MLVLSVVILNNCVADKKTSDEFLIKKKDPLILPPEFGKLPTPGERRAAKRETSIFEETLGRVEEDTSAAPSSIEDSILKKIKKD